MLHDAIAFAFGRLHDVNTNRASKLLYTSWQDDFAAAQQPNVCSASLLAGTITGMIAGHHHAYTLLVFFTCSMKLTMAVSCSGDKPRSGCIWLDCHVS